jgi:hypothetical protein
MALPKILFKNDFKTKGKKENKEELINTLQLYYYKEKGSVDNGLF